MSERSAKREARAEESRACGNRRNRSRSTLGRANVGAYKQSGRATQQRPRPDTGDDASHAGTNYRDRTLRPTHELHVAPTELERQGQQLAALRALLLPPCDVAREGVTRCASRSTDD
jgi:hypothetical protein